MMMVKTNEGNDVTPGGLSPPVASATVNVCFGFQRSQSVPLFSVITQR